MIIITGAAGFIGSVMVARLNAAGRRDLVLVDDFGRADKRPNWQDKHFRQTVDRAALFDFLKDSPTPSAVIHLGARTDTTETNWDVFEELNLSYSQKIWAYCAKQNAPLLYASSAATYGGGEHGFDDRPHPAPLRPLNAYGRSKQDFDLWALAQTEQPPQWQGFKFFNVYGPNEYHKGRMASVVMHAFRQIQATGGMKLFRSHRPDVADGMQSRDFIYVKDVADTLLRFLDHDLPSGIYNLGTGKARSFKDLAVSVFDAMGLPPNISYIDTPTDIRDKYQYFTQADTTKLAAAQPETGAFHTLEDGVRDYVRGYLLENNYL